MESRELRIQFPCLYVEGCHRPPPRYVFALCFPSQGHFTDLFDLWLWFVAVTDFFCCCCAPASVPLQLDF